jgi:hypothetical protein
MLNLLGEAGGAAPTQAKIQAALQVRSLSTPKETCTFTSTVMQIPQCVEKGWPAEGTHCCGPAPSCGELCLAMVHSVSQPASPVAASHKRPINQRPHNGAQP